ncbi:MAG: T9SS type A sorting domain-containing protein, partial [Chitinophagaceae bacterium]
IYWGTASETNNSSFVIEASRSGSDFRAIGTLPGAMNSGLEQHYNFLHKNPAQGKWYYRIKQVDLDGRASYSKTVIIETGRQAFSIGRLYPVPAGENLTMELNSRVACLVKISLTNNSGQVISKSSRLITAGSNQVQVDLHGKAAGVYYIRVEQENGNSQFLRIVKR